MKKRNIIKAGLDSLIPPAPKARAKKTAIKERRKKLQGMIAETKAGGIDSLIPTNAERPKKTAKNELATTMTEELQQLIEQAKALRLRPGRPTKHTEPRSSAEQGCKEGELRYTVVMKKEHIEQLKDVAYWQRGTLKEALAEAVENYLKQYERKNGSIKKRKA